MFTGNEIHDINIDEAAELTANYRAQFSPNQPYIKGQYYSKSAVSGVLNQEGCVGIRIYYGLDENSVPRLVIVGVYANENDIVDGKILEFGSLCPPACGASNALNS